MAKINLSDLKQYKSFCACDKCIKAIEDTGEELELIEEYYKADHEFLKEYGVPVDENYVCDVCGSPADKLCEVGFVD